jgi:hypothetical protein
MKVPVISTSLLLVALAAVLSEGKYATIPEYVRKVSSPKSDDIIFLYPKICGQAQLN